jgi:hypothetical protein
MKLRPTSAYGVRLYQNGSSLVMHYDKVIIKKCCHSFQYLRVMPVVGFISHKAFFVGVVTDKSLLMPTVPAFSYALTFNSLVDCDACDILDCPHRTQVRQRQQALADSD